MTQILLPALVALATAACARQQAAYYAIDPATHQAVPVANTAPYAQPQYAQAQPTPAGGRGLFSSPQLAAQSYAQAGSSQPVYQPQQTPSGRGLFNTYAEASAAPAYAPPAYPQQAYAPPPAAAPQGYAQQTYAQPSYAPQRGYAQQPTAQYQPRQYATSGPLVAARTGNPFAQARWY